MSSSKRRMPGRAAVPALALVGSVAGLTGLVGCGSDDRDMAEPSTDQTTTTSVRGAPSSTAAVGTEEGSTEGVFQLTTTAFATDGPVPDRYTCNGMDVAPDLAWANVPTGTVELALVMDDPDADDFVHWVIAGLDPTSNGLGEGEVPDGAVETHNGFGNPGWAGPCPPEGSGVHHYEFELIALGAPLGLDPDLEAADAAAEIRDSDAILSTTLLVGTVDAG
jgi:Raf kinase inhibitor-like YbhB/YbcL family protein